jgi:integrase
MSIKRDPNLPKNLTYRKARKAFYWRNPVTGKEISLGKISRRDAVAQAIEGNYFIEQNYTPVSLIEKLKGLDTLTMSRWIDSYREILIRRDLAPHTYKTRGNQLLTINEKIGGMILNQITTRHIAEFLEPWIADGKNNMAASMRSVLSDMFREAIVKGHVSQNPVEPTRTPKIIVERERLRFDAYQATRDKADLLPDWFGLSMDLALITGQRREDIVSFRFSHINDDRLYITQKKTGMKLAIPLSLNLPVAGLQLGKVIDRCRKLSNTDFLISVGVRKNSPEGNIHPDGLTKNFVKARKMAKIETSDNPPTFHEIRSLSGRLFKDLHGEEFAQRLLGHTSENTTKLYLDERDEKSFVML